MCGIAAAGGPFGPGVAATRRLGVHSARAYGELLSVGGTSEVVTKQRQRECGELLRLIPVHEEPLYEPVRFGVSAGRQLARLCHRTSSSRRLTVHRARQPFGAFSELDTGAHFVLPTAESPRRMILIAFLADIFKVGRGNLAQQRRGNATTVEDGGM